MYSPRKILKATVTSCLLLSLVQLAGATSANISSQRISEPDTGGAPNGTSFLGVISANKRYLAFESYASNIAGTGSTGIDIFRLDRQTGNLSLISQGLNTTPNEQSYFPGVSGDGRYVVFMSKATDLVAGDTNGVQDIFVRDTISGTTSRVSVATGGAEANGNSDQPAISANGRYVVFNSLATNLVSGDTNAAQDIFMHDRQTGQTTRLSVSSTGAEGATSKRSFYPTISATGRYVAFESEASLIAGMSSNTSNIFVRDVTAGTTQLISRKHTNSNAGGNSLSGQPAISADGRYVIFESTASDLILNDTNGAKDIFVYERQTNTMTRVNVADVTGAAAEGSSTSGHASISADGRYALFESTSTMLVTGDTNGARDVFVRDITAGTTILISQNAGVFGNGSNTEGYLSIDGRFSPFSSQSTNLDANDTNAAEDVYLSENTDITAKQLILARISNSGGSDTGSGTVISNPAGLNCTDYCVGLFTEGLSVTLTATSDSVSEFVGWTSCPSPSGNVCTVTANNFYDITATFIKSDADNDGVKDALDNCPNISNANQANADGDSAGDVCDAFPSNPSETADTDNDGMGNNFESTYGLNPASAADAVLDKDSDGLSNLGEFKAGTNPTKTDTDNDGMGDNFEVVYGLNPLANDASQDKDKDGLTNLEEFLQGSNPSWDATARTRFHGDFNGDGKSDILWRHATTGVNWIYLMNGPLISSSVKLNIVTDLNWNVAGIGDFNGDGKSDILWRHATSGVNWIYLMNGATVTSSVMLNIVTDLNWNVAGIGDFNGDGKSDILWRHATSGVNWIYQMNGAAISSDQKLNTVSDFNWKVTGVGDFNNDGKSDILWRHASTGSNSIYQMSGFTISSIQQVNFVTDSNWKVAGVGDLNGDGQADILWRHATSGSNWIYLMNGASISSSQQLNTISDLNWKITGVGDFNGDGKADILWRHATSGSNWIYLMNGVSISSSQQLNVVSDLNWKVSG